MGIRVVGVIPEGLPEVSVPSWEWAEVQQLLPTALTLSLVAFIEAISVAKAIEDRHGYRVDANQELRALGMANVIGPCSRVIQRQVVFQELQSRNRQVAGRPSPPGSPPWSLCSRWWS